LEKNVFSREDIWKKKLLKPINGKVSKNKIEQKKHIFNSNTNLKQNKNNNNTNRKKKCTNQEWKWKNWYTHNMRLKRFKEFDLLKSYKKDKKDS